MTNQLTRAEIYDHLARLEREGHPRPWEEFEVWRHPRLGELAGRKWDYFDGLIDVAASIEDGLSIRLKPQLPPMVERTIRYPEPPQGWPAHYQRIYVATPTRREYAFASTWTVGKVQCLWFERDLIHLTERNARAHGMALAGCSQDEIDAVLRGEESDAG